MVGIRRLLSIDALTGVGILGVLEVDTGALLRDRGFGIIVNKKTFIWIFPNSVDIDFGRHGAEARTLQLDQVERGQVKAG